MSSQIINPPKWENSLKLYRTNKGYSQSDLADKVGLSQNTIHQIEKGALSGRKHMDSIGTAIKINPSLIFPYYEYLTYSEAATELKVSSTLISKRVDDGSLNSYVVGGVKMVKRSELFTSSVKKRQKKSIRLVLVGFLASKHGKGASVEEMLALFGPFSADEDREKKRKSLQSILSRGDEFLVDKNEKPPRWHLTNG